MPSGLQKTSCDEYPFASTHEGAAFAGYNISVAIVECKYNNAAGALLNGWYDRHRILEKDPFWVDATKKGDTPPENVPPPHRDHHAPRRRRRPRAQSTAESWRVGRFMTARIHSRQPTLPLAHLLGIEAARHVARHPHLHRADAGHHSPAVGCSAILPGQSCRS
ncbi:NucA/NucB deoxyribonuclease domain-containing protein [Nonomuraea angiospora]